MKTKTLDAGNAAPPAADSVVPLPDDCVEAVMSACVGHLGVVVSPSEKEDDVPPFADSVQGWRDFCSGFKSRIKYVLSEAGRLAPLPALLVASSVVSKVPRNAGPSDAELMDEFNSLEVLVILSSQSAYKLHLDTCCLSCIDQWFPVHSINTCLIVFD